MGGRAFVVIEAVRPIVLEAIEPAGDALQARIRPFELNVHERAEEARTIEQSLRELATQLSAALPQPEAACALIAMCDDVDLADLVVANLPYSVAEKAAYAAEPLLVERLRRALELTRRVVAGATAAGG